MSDCPRAVSMSFCEADCLKDLENRELVTLPSGLQYKEIVGGKGASPPVGYQVKLVGCSRGRVVGRGEMAKWGMPA